VEENKPGTLEKGKDKEQTRLKAALVKSCCRQHATLTRKVDSWQIGEVKKREEKKKSCEK
jgi:hypothetical protein